MESRFYTSADGTRLHSLVHGAGARDVLVIGGLAEHAGRYAHVAAAWAGRDCTVTLMELRGHGSSGGARSHVDRWDDYRADVAAVAASLRPGWSLFAHSMGGLVALDCVRDGLRPARLALSNPLCGVKMPVPAWKTGAARTLSRLWPTLALTNEIDPAALSRDAGVGAAYVADPHVYKKVTSRWFTEMTDAQARVVAMPAPPVPVAFFTSETDPITNAGISKVLAERIGAKVVEYPGMLHELVNELGKEQVIADVGDWLLV